MSTENMNPVVVISGKTGDGMSSLLLQSQRKNAEHNLHLNLIEDPIELEIKLKILMGNET